MAELERIALILREASDVLGHRVDAPEPPPWARERGWATYLLDLTDADVQEAERRGLWSLALDDAPETLQRLAASARSLCSPFHPPVERTAPVERQHVPLRKRTQVATLVRRLRDDLGGVSRIVDVGAGHGHFARAVVAALHAPVVGVDHDAARVDVARALAGDAIEFISGTPDAIRLGPDDLVVGLHACGALGDALVRHAAAAGSQLLLVSCCAQKIDEPLRPPLSEGGMTIPRPLLGLSNLSWGDAARQGMHGRQVRHALRLLLRARGVHEPLGEVALGIPKKRFRRSLAAVAPRALARRGLRLATPEEIARCEQAAAREFARIRRLSLPRNMLGRLLELLIVFDRARFLETKGYRVDVSAAFSAAASPRNIGLRARLAKSATNP